MGQHLSFTWVAEKAAQEVARGMEEAARGRGEAVAARGQAAAARGRVEAVGSAAGLEAEVAVVAGVAGEAVAACRTAGA